MNVNSKDGNKLQENSLELECAVDTPDSDPPALTQSAEFSSPEADLVLQSGDGVLFKVFSRILMEASPVFRDMMTIPKPPDEGLQQPLMLNEDGVTLELGLKFLYPIPNPPITTFESLKTLFKLADKYLLDAILHALKTLLVTPLFIEKAPLRVYALACAYGLQEEAKIASRHCLKIDILQEAELYEELSMISGRDLLKLIKLHQTRAAAVLGVLNGSSPSRCDAPGAFNSNGVPLWWLEFKARAKEELRTRPLGDTIFQPKFMASCVNMGVINGCPVCPTNYLSLATQARLEQMKGFIDNLPDTI